MTSVCDFSQEFVIPPKQGGPEHAKGDSIAWHNYFSLKYAEIWSEGQKM